MQFCLQTLADNIFFTVEDAFLLGVAVKIYNLRRLGFFVRPQSKMWFVRHQHVFIFSATETLAHDENHETGQIQAKGLSGEGQSPRVVKDEGLETETLSRLLIVVEGPN